MLAERTKEEDVPARSKLKPTAQIRRWDTPWTYLIQAADCHMDGPGLMKFSWTHGPAAMDPVHGPCTYSTGFLVEK
jgi:hypothetical protein